MERGVVAAFAILCLANTVAAWDNLDVCNSQYTSLQSSYNDLNSKKDDCISNLTSIYRDYDTCNVRKSELTACQKRLSNDSYWKNEYDKCNILYTAEQRLSEDKNSQISSLTTDRDNAKNEVTNCQNNCQQNMGNITAEKGICDNKVQFLNDELMSTKNFLSDTSRNLGDCQHNLNVTQAKVVGTCNEYLASNYYTLWTQLNDDEKDCLGKVLKFDRVAFLTLDTKESIMVMCSLNWNSAVRYLQHFEQLGFIEKDPNSLQFQIDPALATDAKQYLNLAGYFRPVDLSRGCTMRFRDLDNVYMDGKNWGVELTLFWTCLFLAVYVKGRSVVHRILKSY